MSDIEVYLEVLALIKPRYLYVERRWWRYDPDTATWTQARAREQLYRLIQAVWKDQKPDQTPRAYLTLRIMAELAAELASTTFPGRPNPSLEPSAPPAPPPEPEPAP